MKKEKTEKNAMERRKKEMETEEEVDEEKPREKRQGRWGQEDFKEWPP